MHELISCEFITSILLCRFVSQNSRHSHWHSHYELWISYAFHMSAGMCILCALTVTHSHSHAHTCRIKEAHTHTVYFSIEICMSCYWKGMPEARLAKGEGPGGTGCSQCGICACNQSINAVACRWIYSYLPTVNIFAAHSCTNKYAACAAVAVCLMPFLAICKIFAFDWGDLVAINGPTSCPRVINWNATSVR